MRRILLLLAFLSLSRAAQAQYVPAEYFEFRWLGEEYTETPGNGWDLSPVRNGGVDETPCVLDPSSPLLAVKGQRIGEIYCCYIDYGTGLRHIRSTYCPWPFETP